jgi:hypothetical protein
MEIQVAILDQGFKTKRRPCDLYFNLGQDVKKNIY